MKTRFSTPRSLFIAASAPLALLVLTSGLTGCASAGGGVDVPPAAPPPPVKKPFEAPSWDAKQWRSDDHGFSIHYPADFQEQAGQGLFTAASPAMAPRLDVAVSPVRGETPLDVVGTQMVAVFEQIGGGDAKLVSSREGTLQDGVTRAMEFVVDWQFQGAFPLQSLVLVVPTDESSAINVTVSGMAGGDIEELREIAYTLYVD